jgi:hypothetical protein
METIPQPIQQLMETSYHDLIQWGIIQNSVLIIISTIIILIGTWISFKIYKSKNEDNYMWIVICIAISILFSVLLCASIMEIIKIQYFPHAYIIDHITSSITK